MAVTMAETAMGTFSNYRSTVGDVRMKDTDFETGDKSNDSTIHSGHYMVSCLDEPEVDIDTGDAQSGNNETEEPKGYDFESAIKEPSRSYKFGSKNPNSSAIDASLTKLFDCMTLAYSGKLTSPKWKNFKGIRLNIKDKIRLNNIIWREWHMQYIKFRCPIICQFEPPITEKAHTKPEAVVMEGKYWKRRMQSVTTEYKKWRYYFKKRCSEPTTSHEDRAMMQEVAKQVDDESGESHLSPQLYPDNSMMTDEDFIMDLSDTLFSSLNQPFAFPNPKEISQLGNADIIQPGLVQLQPSLEDFMDTLEPLAPLQDILQHKQTTPMVVDPLPSRSDLIESPNSASPISVDFLNTSQSISVFQPTSLASIPEPSPLICTSSTTIKAAPANPVNSLVNFVLDPSELSVQQNSLDSKPVQQPMVVQPVATQPPQTVQQLLAAAAAKKQQHSIQPHLNQTVTNIQANNGKTVTIIPNNSQLAALLGELGMPQSPQQPVVMAAAVPAHVPQPGAPLVTLQNKPSSRSQGSLQQQLVKEESRRASTGSVSSPLLNDGNFRVPQTPVQRNIKPRLCTIAPAPEPKTANTQNTVLAHLLTQGGPLSNFAMKPEQPVLPSSPLPLSSSSQISFASIQPCSTAFSTAQATTCVTFSLPTTTTTTSRSAVSDFQKNLLIQAASSAMGKSTIDLEEATSSAFRDAGYGAGGSPGSPSFHLVNSPDSGDRSRHTSADSGGSNSIWDESPGRSDKPVMKEQRKSSHISAEQKRRCNIKVGFDTLHQLVPSLANNPNAKVSKATTLSKAAEYAQKLKEDRDKMQTEMELLRHQVDSLNNAISICQSQLPATGVPVTRQRVDKMREMFDNYVKSRTLSNWKFWIFSIIIQQLFDSYNSTVSTASVDELCRTVLAWLEQNCSLVALRPAVLASLRQLSTTTSILSDPSKVPEQATKAVTQTRKKHLSSPMS